MITDEADLYLKVLAGQIHAGWDSNRHPACSGSPVLPGLTNPLVERAILPCASSQGMAGNELTKVTGKEVLQGSIDQVIRVNIQQGGCSRVEVPDHSVRIQQENRLPETLYLFMQLKAGFL
jgi:hypothetical protein